MSDSTTGSDNQLQEVEKNLAEISEGLTRSARTTKRVGLVLMALLLGYFVWGFAKINELFNPDQIVPLAGVMVEDNLPGLRQSLQTSLAEQAPVWAEGLSTSAIEAAPSAREQLEDYAMEQTAASIEQAAAVGEREFRAILRDNRTVFEETLEKLSDDEEYSEETLAIFRNAVNEQLGQDMQDQALEVLGTLIALREKLEKLAAGETMNREEATERHALMMIRHLQLREADESFEERIKRRDAQYRLDDEPDSDGEPEVGEATDTPPADSDSDPKDAAPAEKPADADSDPAPEDAAAAKTTEDDDK